MKYEKNVQGMGVFLRGPDARRVTSLGAGRILANARAIVGKHSGKTAASGRLSHSNKGGIRGDRVQVTVTFGEAAVQQQWGRGKSKFLTKALEGL